MLFNEFTHEAAAALLAAKFSHARAHAKRKDNAERIVSRRLEFIESFEPVILIRNLRTAHRLCCAFCFQHGIPCSLLKCFDVDGLRVL